MSPSQYKNFDYSRAIFLFSREIPLSILHPSFKIYRSL